ncbi:MAG TPA: AMP-binding protein [Acetobacteraceae bacterium]|jgi:long-chain acyl-CoA synthetase
MMPATTLPRLLHRNAASVGGRPAFREKRRGIWQVLTWSQYASLVARFAAGLAANGFGRGDRLAVIGDNRPQLYAALLAAQSLGGAGVPLMPDADPEAIARIVADAEVSVVVAEDAELAETIVAMRDRLATLRLIVQAGSQDMHHSESGLLKPFDSVTGPAVTDRSESGDVALILYAEEAPRMMTHRSMLATADAMIAAHDIRRTDETLAWLPMAWSGDVLSSLAMGLTAGFTCNCPERPATSRGDLREIGPTILIAPPRVWETMLTEIEARAAQASRMKRALFARFAAIGERAELRRTAGEEVPAPLRLKLMVGELLIHAPMRDQLGLRHLRWAGTGGEALAPHVLRRLHAFGINLDGDHSVSEPTHAAGEPLHA